MNNEVKLNYRYLIIGIIGILLISMKSNIQLGNIYPEYQMSHNIIPAFQHCTLDLYYGITPQEVWNPDTDTMEVTDMNFSGFKVDIFNDYVGFILTFISMWGLSKRSKYFILGAITSAGAFILKAVVDILPFFLNGQALCYTVFFVGIAAFAARVLISYSYIFGVTGILSSVEFKRDRKAIYLAWFIAFVCSCAVSITTWLFSHVLAYIYLVISLGATLFYLYKIYLLSDYVTGHKKSYVNEGE